MKRYSCVLLLLVSSLSFALTPVAINSASINYTTHTITVVGSGFCTGAVPAVTFNTTRLKVTSACSSSLVVASLPVQAAGSYRLIITNTSAGSATFYVTYGAVGPQGPQGLTGATGATGATGTRGATGAIGPQGPIGLTGATGAAGATGSQGPIGLTGPQGATGAAGPQGPAGTNGAGFNFRNAFDPTATYAINDVVTYTGSTYLASVANGPSALTPDANTSAWVVLAQQGATGPAGPQGLTGAMGPQGSTGAQGTAGTNGTNGTNGIDGINGAQGIQGNPGTNGTNGTGFNFRGPFNPNISYTANDVVTSTPITYNVNVSFGTSGSMVGTITTDGTQGVLSVANVIGWSLKLTDYGTNSTTLTPGNSAFDSGNYNTGSQPNSDFTATPTNLTFTYSNGGFWSVAGASGQFCITDWSNCFGPIAFGTWSINGDNQYSQSGAGGGSLQVIGTGGTTGGTSTYVATGPVAANTATLGTLPWTMMAQAGAPGASGPSGAAGPQGPQGLQGPIGFTGAAGSPGAPGPQGSPGINGTQGIQGIPGTNGTNGTNGTGFNFRGIFNTNTTYAVNDVVTFAPSANNITYNVNLTFGSAGSMFGTITTDGTLGVLNTSNIVSWNLTLADSATNSTILTPSNSAFSSGNYNTGGQPNNDFTATSTTLTMTYSNGGFWGVSGATGQFCMTDWSNCFGPVAYGTWSINGDNAYSETAAGAGSSQTIGSGGTASTPATSTYVATSSVAANTATPGTAPWVMMAQAGAPGASGTNGTNGTNGINGLPGAQGPQGVQGAASTVPGPQGPQGNPGSNGTNGLNGTPGPSLSEMRAALLQWYPQTYSAGTNPAAIAFDGSSLWITNYTSNVVTKLRANDGVIVGTYSTGAWSLGIAFDGANIWVVNSNSNTVTKLQASDGTLVGTYSVGSSPSEAVFDGANIWVTNTWSNSVTELRATDGTVMGSYSTGTNPKGITFDGANIWVSNYGSNNMTELRASDGTLLGTFTLGTGPYGVAFDGLNIWAVNGGDNTVTKLRASDGTLIGTYPVGHTPYYIAFDGSNIWVTNGGDNTVTKLRASSGALVGTYPVGLRPDMVAFDGNNVWVTNDGGGVTRIGATK
jgi:Collagen triple helix repeat (20 copies)